MRELLNNWQAVRSRADLQQRLNAAADLLRRAGHYDMAGEWQARIRRMPQRMSKEQINLVLWAAWFEIEKAGLTEA